MPISLPSQLTKTIACAYNELQNITTEAVKWFLDSTLNDKYGIVPVTEPVARPRLKYFGIGTKGFKNLDVGQLSAPYIPSGANLDLFEPIPFRVRPIDDDLTPEERVNYRMRVIKTFNGEDYYCYYLKMVTVLDNEVKLIQTEIASGDETELDGLDPNNLNPVPTVTTAEEAVDVTDEVTASITATLSLTGAEIQEVVAIIYDGDLLRSRISEIGIYTGEDLAGVNDGDGGTYTEAAYVQLAYHYCNLGNDFSDQSKIETFNLRISSANAFLS